MKKKGLSDVIATVILIALVMAATAVVWGAVNKIIRDKTNDACMDVGFSQKVTINEDYTCYNSTDDQIQFSLAIWDVNIDGVLVSVTSSGNSKSYTITNTPQTIAGLVNYPDKSTSIKLPAKNSGLTYIATGFPTEVDSIKIAPIVGDKQCELSDQINQIEDCSVFVN
jgi:FlaG/FlaF family flagellin (archaellin)